jgi:excisionase family DNA binding protein
MPTDLALTISEVCKFGRIGRTSLYASIGSGELRAVKRGRRTLILAEDLRRWLDSLPSLHDGSPRANDLSRTRH